MLSRLEINTLECNFGGVQTMELTELNKKVLIYMKCLFKMMHGKTAIEIYVLFLDKMVKQFRA